MRTIAWVGGAALAVAAAAAVAALGTGIATATPTSTTPATATQPAPDPEPPEVPLSGNVLDRASAAALQHTGGGTVTETEVGDDGAAYGVEVRKPDGRHVEIGLNDAFVVTGEEADDADDD